MKLMPLNVDDAQERHSLVEFVNLHYTSELPMSEASVTSGKVICFWAKEDGTGKRLGVTGYMPKTPYLAETVKTVIHPDFRGKGLGTKLSQLIEEELRNRGFKKIMTTIYITNLAMIFVKLKQGYLFEGFHPNHEKPGLHEYSLGKVLL